MTADRKPLKDITALTEVIMAEHTAYGTDKESVRAYVADCVAEVIKLKMYIDTVGTSVPGARIPCNGIELCVNGIEKLYLSVNTDKGPVYYKTREGMQRMAVTEPTCEEIKLTDAIDQFPNILTTGMSVFAFQQKALGKAQEKSKNMKAKANGISEAKKEVAKKTMELYKGLYEQFKLEYESA